VTPGNLCDAVGAARVNAVDLEAGINQVSTVTLSKPFNGSLCPRQVVVSHDHLFEERTSRGNLCDGVTDATRTNEKDTHIATLSP
jgi:hypothetical protein